jgi:hypothetical protein
VSERRQREARDRRDAAQEREADARERASVHRKRGEGRLVRLHEDAADRQAESAEQAEQLREADVRIEGDQLDGE